MPRSHVFRFRSWQHAHTASFASLSTSRCSFRFEHCVTCISPLRVNNTFLVMTVRPRIQVLYCAAFFSLPYSWINLNRISENTNNVKIWPLWLSNLTPTAMLLSVHLLSHADENKRNETKQTGIVMFSSVNWHFDTRRQTVDLLTIQ